MTHNLMHSAAEHAAHAALELRDRSHPADDGDLCQLAADIGRAMAFKESYIDEAGGTLCEVRAAVVDHFVTVAIGRDSHYTIPEYLHTDLGTALHVVDCFLALRLEEGRAAETERRAALDHRGQP